MNVLLVATLLATQPAAPSDPPGQPASRPAPKSAKPGGTGADINAETTLIFELEERRLKVEENWTLKNDSDRLVNHVNFRIPDGGFRLTLPTETRAFAANEPGTAFGSTGPLGPGQHNAVARYFFPYSGAAAVLAWTLPVNMTACRMIIEDTPGISIQSNVGVVCEPRPLNGLNFKVCTFEGVPAGGRFELRLFGLPTRPTWPLNLALVLSLGFIAWMVVALRRQFAPSSASAGQMSPISAVARREQIVRALQLLEEDRAADRVPAKRFERRQRELMAQLADVLREIELTREAE